MKTCRFLDVRRIYMQFSKKAKRNFFSKITSFEYTQNKKLQDTVKSFFISEGFKSNENIRINIDNSKTKSDPSQLVNEGGNAEQINGLVLILKGPTRHERVKYATELSTIDHVISE